MQFPKIESWYHLKYLCHSKKTNTQLNSSSYWLLGCPLLSFELPFFPLFSLPLAFMFTAAPPSKHVSMTVFLHIHPPPPYSYAVFTALVGSLNLREQDLEMSLTQSPTLFRASDSVCSEGKKSPPVKCPVTRTSHSWQKQVFFHRDTWMIPAEVSSCLSTTPGRNMKHIPRTVLCLEETGHKTLVLSYCLLPRSRKSPPTVSAVDGFPTMEDRGLSHLLTFATFSFRFASHPFRWAWENELKPSLFFPF